MAGQGEEEGRQAWTGGDIEGREQECVLPLIIFRVLIDNIKIRVRPSGSAPNCPWPSSSGTALPGRRPTSSDSPCP